ncbi:integrase [Vibrio galatheae]|uniref:Integrase n=1 Tax=Vibrio galatheae TaxID=579748 RepID=A0A0F4NPN2_9VIBR|nr:site-specific integrase [Vibrio galatheae]KJY84803.1 integrase [Vibrio galatheae]
MTKKLPTGVEIHSGLVRIWFMYRGQRCREPLGIPPTSKNLKLAGERRSSIVHAIRTGNFDYMQWFPQSKQAHKFTKSHNKETTLNALCEKWLTVKQVEVTPATLKNYIQRLGQMRLFISGDKLISTLTQSDLLELRQYFLSTTSSSTANSYMRTIKGMLGYAATNGLIEERVLAGVKELKTDKSKPTPLSKEEFARLINASRHEQDQNLWTTAVFTGLRHGELIALAWEDIDLVNGTITVKRNRTLEGELKLPKTKSGERVVTMLQPAIDALIRQKALTFMMPAITIDVAQREYGKLSRSKIRPVFSPRVTATKKLGIGDFFSHVTLHEKWHSTSRRAGIEQRKPYQTRHTYACWMLSAGANPTFIASQMGHSSAKEVYNTYGDWVDEHTQDQVAMLNKKYGANVTHMPRRDFKSL